MRRLLPLLAALLLLAGMMVPGPCAFDEHAELDCADGGSCPDGLVCQDDEYCKFAEDVCGTGFTGCEGRCVDPERNEEHCGACGIACSDDETCCGGACTATPDGGACP